MNEIGNIHSVCCSTVLAAVDSEPANPDECDWHPTVSRVGKESRKSAEMGGLAVQYVMVSLKRMVEPDQARRDGKVSRVLVRTSCPGSSGRSDRPSRRSRLRVLVLCYSLNPYQTRERNMAPSQTTTPGPVLGAPFVGNADAVGAPKSPPKCREW